MNTHRLFHLMFETPPAVAVAVGYVPCPVVLVQAASPEHQRWMAELYRIAYEQAQSVHRPSRWARLYRASVN